MKTNKLQDLTFLFFITLSLHAQKKVVNGQIITFKNITVENAKITVKKTKHSVFSDSLGFFSITCDLKDKISITAAGFKSKQVKVKNIKDSLNVSLIISGSEEDINLAMNNGHINEEERNLVNKHFKSGQLYSLGFTNMTDLIKGKFPRVNIINDELIIRGKNTFSNSNNSKPRNGALIIINGTEYRWSSVKSMIVTNVKDIKILNSLEASRYGAGSGNGVVVIKLVDE